jgi:hypothetical protein
MTMCVGCDSAKPAGEDRDTAHLKVLGILYGQYLAEHGGKTPSSLEVFAGYLQREPANWQKLAESPQEFLSSAGEGKPIVVLFGNDVKPDEGGSVWVAYEAAGSGGSRRAVNAQGRVQLLNDQEFNQLFPEKP